jgi:hypothetical protein
LLAREQSLVAQADSIPRLITAARVLERGSRRRTYVEHDVIAASAALGRDVAHAFDAADVSLQRVETRESSVRPDGLRELTIDIRAEGDFEGILTTLASLEANERLVHITRISIEGGSTYSHSTPDTSVAPRLTVVATIRGYGP